MDLTTHISAPSIWESKITDKLDVPHNISKNIGKSTIKKKRQKIERTPTDLMPLNLSNNIGELTKATKTRQLARNFIDSMHMPLNNVPKNAETTTQKRKPRVYTRKPKMHESEEVNNPRIMRAKIAKRMRDNRKIREQEYMDEIAELKQKCESNSKLKDENINLKKVVKEQAEKIKKLEALLNTATLAETVEMVKHFYTAAKLLPQNAEIYVRPQVLQTLAPVLSAEEVERVCHEVEENKKDYYEPTKPGFRKRFLKMTTTIDYSNESPQQSRLKVNLMTDEAESLNEVQKKS